jgi:methionine-rich copper-binding protein CopC
MRLILPLAACLALVAWAVAFAHAEPLRVSPGEGAVVTTAPARVSVEMTQEMARVAGGNELRVFDAQGAEVTGTAGVIDNANRKLITVALPAAMAPGTYTVRWKTTSAEDGDPAEGEYSFTFDPNGTASPGKEVLREDLLGSAAGETPAAAQAPVSLGSGSDEVSWALLIAVGLGMFVIGSGATFLLVQRRA